MVTAHDRTQLAKALDRTLGDQPAGTLMELLPTVPAAELATAAQLEAVRHELKGDIGSLRHELKGDIAELRGEVRELRGELLGEISEGRGGLSEVRGEISLVRGEILEVRGEISEVKGGLAALTATVDALAPKLVLAMVASAAALAALFGLALTLVT